jgi:hypothetical protein
VQKCILRGSVSDWQIACMAEGNHSTNPSIDAPSNDGIQVRDSSGDPKAPRFRVRSTGRGLGVDRRLMIWVDANSPPTRHSRTRPHSSVGVMAMLPP